MALFEIVLNLNESYKRIIDQYLFIVCSLIFMIILEPMDKLTSVSLLFYNVLGMLFYELVLKQIVQIK